MCYNYWHIALCLQSPYDIPPHGDATKNATGKERKFVNVYKKKRSWYILIHIENVFGLLIYIILLHICLYEAYNADRTVINHVYRMNLISLGSSNRNPLNSCFSRGSYTFYWSWYEPYILVKALKFSKSIQSFVFRICIRTWIFNISFDWKSTHNKNISAITKFWFNNSINETRSYDSKLRMFY